RLRPGRRRRRVSHAARRGVARELAASAARHTDCAERGGQRSVKGEGKGQRKKQRAEGKSQKERNRRPPCLLPCAFCLLLHAEESHFVNRITPDSAMVAGYAIIGRMKPIWTSG